MKILKLKALAILGLVMTIALVATTFVVYSYAAPTQIRAVNGEYGEMHGENYGMHNHWEEMHNECTEMMNEMHNSTIHDSMMDNSTMHSETDGPHHGCH